MAEEIVRGPAHLVPASVQGLLFRPRNAESLARLGDLAVGRDTRSRSTGETTIR
jgi:hypothetical protein